MNNTIIICNECNQLTSGKCWRHGGQYQVPAPTYHLHIEWVNGRVERIKVEYVDGKTEWFRR